MTTPLEKLPAQLRKKLPVLGTSDQRIMLQKTFLKQLTDTEFIILWNMPNLDIIVTENTRAYIEKRRCELGLKFTKEAGFDLKQEEEK